MGCKTCNQKKEKERVINDDKDTLDVNLLPKSVQQGGFENGSIAFKIIAFLVIVIAIPLIIVVLVGQIFLHFFLPKSLPKVTSKFRNFFIGLLNRYGKYRHDKEVRKRKRQFEKNAGYLEDIKLVNVVDYEETSEFDDVEVHDNNNDVKK